MVSEFPERERCVLGPILEQRAKEHPDKVYVVTSQGDQVTYGQMLDLVRVTAAGLQALGVRQDDKVLVWLPNSVDMLRVWYAINYLGAVYVPINTAYRGSLLAHVVENSDAELIVCHAGLLERIGEISAPRLRTAVVLGGDPAATPGVESLPASALDGDPAVLKEPERPIQPWDTQSIIYTSGTTGASKGVLSSYAHLWTTGRVAVGPLGPEDRFMLSLPLFHAGGTISAYGMMAIGASIALVPGFDTGSFWRVVRDTGTTGCTLLGAMASFLVNQAPVEEERGHGLRAVWIIPLTEDAIAFGERFGVDVRTTFNMTEISTPLISEPNPKVIGTCGRVRPGVEVRLVDEFDREVAVGQVGEMMLRTDLPWTLSHGYHRMPEATATAWRNGWFHSGDAFRRDEDGNFFFVDRKKDAIRRRGENISSFEVEAEVLAHPAVREAAVVAVPSEFGEDEVLVVVAPAPNQELDPEDLVRFLAGRMAHFMVPRYVRVLDELPKTPTAKVEKYRLRSEGVTADTWDREQAGISIRRPRLA